MYLQVIFYLCVYKSKYTYCCLRRVVLHRTLFKSNEVLLGCLLHIRSLCEAASSSSDGLGEGDAAISLIKLDSSMTLTLDEFLDTQQLQSEAALKQLNELRDRVVDIVWQACVVRDGLKISQNPKTQYVVWDIR